MPTTRPEPLIIFACGCIGAVAPEIIRLYKLRQHRGDIDFPWWYFAITIALAVLGGVVAVMLDSSPIWSAFVAGAAIQYTISALAGSGDGMVATQKPSLSDEDIERIAEKVLEVINDSK